LPAVNDSVIVEWPYNIKVGAATSYFANTAPTIVYFHGNAGNLKKESFFSIWTLITGNI
jgi:hypothetical protein